MMLTRRTTRQVRIGNVAIGGDAPVSIQSMTKTETADVAATVRQIRSLATAGCDIVRVAVPTIEAARSLPEIRREANKVPLVADIHFHPQFAIAAIESGFDKIRWNPGNIRHTERVRDVVERCLERRIPIRIGVNVGSLDPECEAAYPGNLVEAIVQRDRKSTRLNSSHSSIS